MARKTLTVTIGAEGGRDRGKVFLVTEAPARQAERWATRALLLAAQSGAEVGNFRSGMAGIAMAGIATVVGGVRFADVEPLLEEMMTCVQVLPTPGRPELVRPLVDLGTEGDDIEEVATRMRLRMEVLDLHLGFSFADALSKLTTKAPAEEG